MRDAGPCRRGARAILNLPLQTTLLPVTSPVWAADWGYTGLTKNLGCVKAPMEGGATRNGHSRSERRYTCGSALSAPRAWHGPPLLPQRTPRPAPSPRKEGTQDGTSEGVDGRAGLWRLAGGPGVECVVAACGGRWRQWRSMADGWEGQGTRQYKPPPAHPSPFDSRVMRPHRPPPALSACDPRSSASSRPSEQAPPKVCIPG